MTEYVEVIEERVAVLEGRNGWGLSANIAMRGAGEGEGRISGEKIKQEESASPGIEIHIGDWPVDALGGTLIQLLQHA